MLRQPNLAFAADVGRCDHESLRLKRNCGEIYEGAASDPWGQRGVIVAVDPGAEHGIGAVRVRYDDGREIRYSMLGHPFRKIDAE